MTPTATDDVDAEDLTLSSIAFASVSNRTADGRLKDWLVIDQAQMSTYTTMRRLAGDA